MAVIKYKDKNGNWKTLTESVNVSVDASGSHIGDEEPVDPSVRVWYDTSYLPTPVAKCKLDSGEWVIVAGGGGGSSSGGSLNNAKFEVSYTTEWRQKSISYGADCYINFKWSSIEDETETGNGFVEIVVNDKSKPPREIKQGDIEINIKDQLVLGDNTVDIIVSDTYGNSKMSRFRVNTVSVSISSYFDSTTAYTGEINYSYTPVGAVDKTVYFLIDAIRGYFNSEDNLFYESKVPITDDVGVYYVYSSPITGESEKIYFDKETHAVYSWMNSAFIYTPNSEKIGIQTVATANREQSFIIPSQSHGSHTFEVYFECNIDGQNVESNHLFYDIICYEQGNNTPIIACAFNTASVKQFATLPIEWIVYVPQLLTADVDIIDNFGYSKSLTSVDRTVQTLSYKAENIGLTNITFKAGEITKVISFETIENQIDVMAEPNNLELYLTAKNRSNNEDENSRSLWQYEATNGTITAQMDYFNFVSDGWQLDKNKDTVLRVSGDARVYIPFHIFGSDFKTNGKTIEFEFATRDVLDYDTVILSCMSSDIGVKITAQKALLSFEGGEISTQYKEDEHIRIAFTIEKKAENRLVKIYINGIMSGVLQYSDNTDFSQRYPIGISIGSNKCTTDIYCIRVYNTNLSQYQILDNWIADTQNIEELIERYDRNNIFDKYDNVSISQLPQTLPYLVLEAENYKYLPQYKGDKERPVSGRYVDPLYPQRSFTFDNAQIDVQGTSSQYYARKNYKIKFKKGFTINNEWSETYQLRETSVPTNVFTFKADVASSEGVNNVELCKLYDDICPAKTPPQLEVREDGGKVRQGIEGYPCLIFYYDGESYYLLGKYNFNNDKGTPEVFGFDDNDESWEILLNNTNMAKWKDTDFTSTYIDEEDNEEKLVWTKTFEARHPEDNTDITNLQALTEWLCSTDTTAVNTEEEKAERLAKFTNELSHWFNVDMLIFNYIFTELFLLVDNRAKNAFPTRFDEDKKWVILPYDYDTAIGTNNEGKLQFGYQFEDTDFIRGKELITAEQAEKQGIDVETDKTVDYTYNGQDSVLYVNLRKCFSREIKAMYQQLRSKGVLSYEEVERRFAEHQNVWGEAVFNEDARFKYIDPLIEEGNSTYLPMLQGSKAEQRKWWLYNRFRYLDSKYNTGDASTDYINLKAFALSDITLTPYADIYATASFDGIIKQTRAFRGKEYTIKNPADSAQGQVIAIYSAPQIAQIGDMSGFDLGLADFSKATRLSGELKIGDENRENAKLTELTIGNLTLLSTINAMNCTALGKGAIPTVDVSGCTNIEHLYFEGTQIKGITLPNGGILKTLHLPETITNLTIRNQPLLTNFLIPSYTNISTLYLEGINYELFDVISILNQIQTNSRVRLLGLEINLETAEEIFELYDKFDTFRGVDENSNTLNNAVIEGIIHCGTITSNDYALMMARYPNVKIDYEHITSTVSFYVEGELVCPPILIFDGANCPNPIDEGIIDIPTKSETDTSKFIYNSWDTSLENITEDTIVNAVFDEYKKYFVTFKDDKGKIVQVRDKDGVLKDTIVYYDRIDENGVNEAVVTVPSEFIPNETKYEEVIDGITYQFWFNYWVNTETGTHNVLNVSGDTYHITYQAFFSDYRVYVVKFIDYNNTVLNTQYLLEGETIEKFRNLDRWESSNGQYYHNFKGWSTLGANLNGENVEDIATVMGTEDLTYYAVYNSITRTYDITFYGIVGGLEHKKDKLLDKYTKTYEWGKSIIIPTAEDLAVEGYTFNNTWFNEFGEEVTIDSTVLGDRVYKAGYNINKYIINFVNENTDGTTELLFSKEVEYGKTPDISDMETPTMKEDIQHTYTFVGWDSTIGVVTGDWTYKARYRADLKEYEIHFLDHKGFIIEDGGIVKCKFGTIPPAPVPVRANYTLKGWKQVVNGEVIDTLYSTPPSVSGTATYMAYFEPTLFNAISRPNQGNNSNMYDADPDTYHEAKPSVLPANFKHYGFNFGVDLSKVEIKKMTIWVKCYSGSEYTTVDVECGLHIGDSSTYDVGSKNLINKTTAETKYRDYVLDIPGVTESIFNYCGKSLEEVLTLSTEENYFFEYWIKVNTSKTFTSALARLYDTYIEIEYSIPDGD